MYSSCAIPLATTRGVKPRWSLTRGQTTGGLNFYVSASGRGWYIHDTYMIHTWYWYMYVHKPKMLYNIFQILQWEKKNWCKLSGIRLLTWVICFVEISMEISYKMFTGHMFHWLLWIFCCLNDWLNNKYCPHGMTGSELSICDKPTTRQLKVFHHGCYSSYDHFPKVWNF